MRFMVYTLLVAVLLLSGIVSYQFHQIDQTRAQGRAQTCGRIAALDNTLIGLIRAGERNAATLSYYKRHPGELARVIAQDEAAVRALTPPAYC